MPLPLPVLDDRSYQDLVDGMRERLPRIGAALDRSQRLRSRHHAARAVLRIWATRCSIASIA